MLGLQIPLTKPPDICRFQEDPVSSNEDIEKERDTVRAILDRAASMDGNLIAILLEIQREVGYLPRHAMTETASRLGISVTDVWSVATFYNEFRFIPRGKYHVKVCLGTACHIKGGTIIMQEWERKLGIKEGDVTDDRAFSLGSVGCVGCCTLAPVVVMNEEVQGKMSPIKVEGLMLKTRLAKDRTGEKHDPS
jgi:NADH-quinone oxidoreductase subunit E